jgi:Leucine-rich repeat (LRR) protein
MDEAKRSGDFILTSLRLTRKNALDIVDLCELPLLYSLRLVNLGLSVVHPQLGVHMTILKSLSFAQNAISTLPDSFGLMSNLEVVNLSSVSCVMQRWPCSTYDIIALLPVSCRTTPPPRRSH